MIFALVTNDAGLNAVAGIATVLCIFGAIVAWAIHGEKKKPGENEDNRGNLK